MLEELLLVQREFSADDNSLPGAINADPYDTDYVPALAANLKDFPRTYSVACGLDPMRDDAIIMNNELAKAGVKTKIDIYPGLPHIFWVFDGLPSTRKFYENVLEGISFVLS
jgi:versiconal hemiacetal acetate esterase